MVLVGVGSPEQAEAFCARRPTPFECVVSPDRTAHRAFGLHRGTFSQVAGPRVWLPWVKNVVTGKPQTAWRGKGDAAQLPGTFVVDPEGVIRYAYRGERSSDLAPNDDVLAALSSIAERKGTS